MGLLFVITLLTFLQAFDSRFISFVINIFHARRHRHSERSNLKCMIDELSKISMTDEWAKYAKLQRKINAEKDKLEKIDNEDRNIILKIRGGVTLFTKFAIGLTLLIVALWYRTTAVTAIPPDIMYPLSSFICWSEDIPGGITAPAWIIMSSTAARAVTSLL